MELVRFDIEGPVLIKPRIFADERGYFYESYNELMFQQNHLETGFVQDNQSLSKKGTLRGLHFQNPPYAQGKLVRVVNGAVMDVAVDIRKKSPTFGKHIKVELTGENKLMLWIPPGFAHGFITLEENTLFLYKCTNLYNKSSESGIIWNDADLNIDWGFDKPLVSDKDLLLADLVTCDNRFY
jgi:dTDP-4-dehydrorhamnose 3,5-epimerase